jgi:hypothetical protein
MLLAFTVASAGVRSGVEIGSTRFVGTFGGLPPIVEWVVGMSEGPKKATG